MIEVKYKTIHPCSPLVSPHLHYFLFSFSTASATSRHQLDQTLDKYKTNRTKTVHWLPVRFTVDFKIFKTFKGLHGTRFEPWKKLI